MRRSAWTLLLAAACGHEAGQPAAASTAPPPALQPFLPELLRLAQAPPAPPEAEQRELREYADIALQLVAADDRTAVRVEHALLQHAHVLWALEPALAHEQVAVRRRAAWLLGRCGNATAQLPLLLRLKYENDAEAVLRVAEALHRLGNDAGLGWLDAAMGVAEPLQSAGRIAIELLAARGEELPGQPTWADLRQRLRALQDHWREQGTGSSKEPPPVDARAIEARLAAHLATTEGTQLRPVDDARFVLTRAGRPALPLLLRTLPAAEPYLRTMALQVLAELGPAARGVAAAIVPLLDDPLTAAYAIRALGELGATDAAPRLRPFLEVPDTELRAAAAGALGCLRDAASAPRLAALLADAQQPLDVRVQAAFARLCLGADAAAEAFLAEREQRGDYHAPTLARLRERLAARR